MTQLGKFCAWVDVSTACTLICNCGGHGPAAFVVGALLSLPPQVTQLAGAKSFELQKNVASLRQPRKVCTTGASA